MAILEAPPIPTHNVSVINGGSEILGLTYTAAKKITWQNKMQSPTTIVPKKPTKGITFDDSDLQRVTGPHHDSLVSRFKLVGQQLAGS